MAYTKPQVIAQNASSGSYAAGCPAEDCKDCGGYTNSSGSHTTNCKACERTR